MKTNYKTSLPLVGVGTAVFNKGRVLLVQRKNPPGKGLWAIPGGKLRLGETLQHCAEREVFEETSVKIKALEPVFAFDLIEWDKKGKLLFHFVIVDLNAKYISGSPCPLDDALDARWVSEGEFFSEEVYQETASCLLKTYNFDIIKK